MLLKALLRRAIKVKHQIRAIFWCTVSTQYCQIIKASRHTQLFSCVGCWSRGCNCL